MIKLIHVNIKSLAVIFILLSALSACKHKKKMQKTEEAVLNPVGADTLSGRCRLDYKNSKALTKYIKENEFNYTWVSAKANVESSIDGKDESFDIKLKIRKDSAMLISIQYLLGLQVAKVLITKDTVKFVDYIHKNYFIGDFNYINDVINADLDYDVLQAVLFGNSAEYHDEENRLKPVTDRQNCHYLLSTERKRRLRKIKQGDSDLKKALQTLTLNPDNYKIIKNEFVDPSTNRSFTADYRNFIQKDSVYAPYLVDIDIQAEKKAKMKIEYVRIEKNTPQKLDLNIQPKYELMQIQKKPK